MFENEFGFIDGMQFLSFMMQCENNKDINNRELLKHVHRDIIALEEHLTRIERKLDAISQIVYSSEDNKQDEE